MRATFVCVAIALCIAANSQAIINGPIDTTDTAVMALSISSETSSHICTGALITPTVIMTAAHCLDPAVVGEHPTIKAYQGSDWAHPEQVYTTQSFAYSAEFNFEAANHGHDIGFVIFADPIPLTPIPVNRTQLTGKEVGETAHMIGFGRSVADNSDSHGIRRDSFSTLSGFTDELLYFNVSDVCSGDSGGPVLMTIDGVEVIVGVTSYAYSDCQHESVATRVDTALDFIDSYFPGQTEPPRHTGGCSFSGF